MMNMGNESGDKCPFDLNFDPSTFKVGDVVSYRVEGSMMDMPFVGVLVDVHDDYVLLTHYGETPTTESNVMRGTRTDRPIVSEADALK
ncbi:Uncharacterised protein [Zhongshania aliphaticivorans]|uniref:Uncharacterized protein n=1 Tax=Zhongshania aliphaticivorans TaxID=1470434 RepID=A0A5S9QUT7_9GAMM|nr:hypothetical protein [Zhongshania aliphaticivorans]CAA0110465.1 Uncharacterised protein [Zhongshania aliphaticivorans]CAA0118149.1 Uncharacterised protein [Zhongshania aliphaticivorans]CAA0122143.1 Uncharacterised protein [Zhongshania aliphaticivorans]